jgi:outer membrane protein assembly factor BamD
VGGKKAKKEKKKEVKLTAQQKKRIEIEQGGRTALQWYDQAVATYRSGKYLDARAILLPLEDSARALDIQEQVKLLIADSYFAQGGALNLAEALARYKSFSTFFPSSEHAEYVQFQIARSYYKQMAPMDRDQSFTDSVVAEYSKFLALYPGSQRAEQAKKELAEARILRARSEFEVAKFYWEWKDFRGSATRLRTVLQEYPELPERDEALYMCAQSLYNSGERAEGDSYAARLEQDYPGSAWKAKLDSGAAGGKTIEQQVQKQMKADKQSARSSSRQARQDRKRTKQIRKDSGLPGTVPGVSQAAHAGEPAPPARPADAAAPETATASSSAAAAEAKQRDRERADKLEAEEAERLAKDGEQQARRDAKQAEADAKAADKAAKEAAKREAKAAGMSDAAKEQAAAKEAKAAAAEKARVDELEADEAKKAAREAEAQKRREEEEAAKAAKKAEKKAAKK